MPPLLGDSGKSTGDNPSLDIFTPDKGKLKDPVTLEFIIFRAETSAERLVPVPVFPSSGRQVVDLTDLPTGAKVGLGHFVAKVDVANDFVAKTAGRHVIRWFFKFDVTEDERVVEDEFDLVLGADFSIRRFSYALLSDLRREGLSVASLPDDRALDLLPEAADAINHATGRFFGVKRIEAKLDGNNARELLLNDVLIALEKLEVINTTLLGASSGIIDPEDLFIYARHLFSGTLDPDDRENPKISFIKRTDLFGLRDPRAASLLFRDRLLFPSGAQNILLDGIWGYTDPDRRKPKNQVGIIPRKIREACIRIVLRDSAPIGDTDAQQALRTGPIKQEKTREQSITYAVPDSVVAANSSGFFGDAQIDKLLAQFRSPVALGAA